MKTTVYMVIFAGGFIFANFVSQNFVKISTSIYVYV